MTKLNRPKASVHVHSRTQQIMCL